MGYQKVRDSAWADTEDVALIPTGTVVTATGTTTGLETGDRTVARLAAVCTAVAGAGSLAIDVQTSRDNSTWVTVASFSAVAGAGTENKVFGPLDRYVRLNYTLTGTSVTLGVTGELV